MCVCVWELKVSFVLFSRCYWWTNKQQFQSHRYSAFIKMIINMCTFLFFSYGFTVVHWVCGSCTGLLQTLTQCHARKQVMMSLPVVKVEAPGSRPAESWRTGADPETMMRKCWFQPDVLYNFIVYRFIVSVLQGYYC